MAWVLAVVVAACGEEPTSASSVNLPTGREGLPATPDQIVENGEHVITVDGVKKALIQAEQMYFLQDLGKVIGDTISVTFFDENGLRQSLLTARTGELDQETREMLAEGSVHVQGETSWIRTEELRYHPERNLVTSDTTTEIHQDGNVIRGTGIESDPALTELKIRGASAVIRNENVLSGPAADTTDAEEGPSVEPDGTEEAGAGTPVSGVEAATGADTLPETRTEPADSAEAGPDPPAGGGEDPTGGADEPTPGDTL